MQNILFPSSYIAENKVKKITLEEIVIDFEKHFIAGGVMIAGMLKRNRY